MKVQGIYEPGLYGKTAEGMGTDLGCGRVGDWGLKGGRSHRVPLLAAAATGLVATRQVVSQGR